MGNSIEVMSFVRMALKSSCGVSIVAHTFNPNTQGTESGGTQLSWRSAWCTEPVPSQRGLHSTILSQNKQIDRQSKPTTTPKSPRKQQDKKDKQDNDKQTLVEDGSQMGEAQGGEHWRKGGIELEVGVDGGKVTSQVR